MACILLSYLYVTWVSKLFAPSISFVPHDDSCSGGRSTRTCPSPYNPLAPGIPLFFLFPSPQLLRSICELKSPTTHIVWSWTSPHLYFCVWQVGCHWWGLPGNWDGSGSEVERKEEGMSCYHGDRAVMPTMPSFRWLPGWRAAGLKGRTKNPCCPWRNKDRPWTGTHGCHAVLDKPLHSESQWFYSYAE